MSIELILMLAVYCIIPLAVMVLITWKFPVRAKFSRWLLYMNLVTIGYLLMLFLVLYFSFHRHSFGFFYESMLVFLMWYFYFPFLFAGISIISSLMFHSFPLRSKREND